MAKAPRRSKTKPTRTMKAGRRGSTATKRRGAGKSARRRMAARSGRSAGAKKSARRRRPIRQSGRLRAGKKTARRLAHRRFLLPQKFDEQLAHALGLLLLNPVARALDAMATQHPRARRILHALEAARDLIRPPVTLARDEDRGDVDRPAGEQLKLRVVGARRPAAIPIETALESGPLVLGARALHVEIRTQERVNPLRAIMQVGVRLRVE
jgi:hypothetical protein